MTIKPRHTKRPKPYAGPAWRRYGQDRAIEPLDAGLMRTLRVKE